MPKQPDRMLFDMIEDAQDQIQQIKGKGYNSAFLVHLILKMIPVGLIATEEIFNTLLQERFTAQLILIFIVFQFWMTKNITGKRMLGLRWFFGEDQYGQERLMFQCRANPEYIDMLKPKLFWIVQFIYPLIPFLFIIGHLLFITQALRVETKSILLNVAIVVSGVTNIFYYFKVSDLAAQRQNVLRTRLGMEYVRKLGLGSITSHY